MKFNLRIGDLEVRSQGKHLVSKGDHITAEIIKWYDMDGRDACFSLAYWQRNNEGYELKFVGGRPFLVDGEVFMQLAKHGQGILDDWFENENKNND